MRRKNPRLKAFYDQVYAKGEARHYTKLLFSKGELALDRVAVLKEVRWRGKRVLDVGCGTGEFPYLVAMQGAAQVVGVDYSAEAIAIARRTHRHPRLRFEKKDVKNVRGKFDVVVSLGTIEHMDRPLATLRHLKRLLAAGGSLIISCPNWSNPRGYILQTLRFLFNARITLADIHYLTPVEFQRFAKALKMKLTWRTVDQDWSHRQKLLRDFQRRLPNVARDSKLPTSQKRIKEFIRWIEEHIIPLERDLPHTGAIGVYHFQKK